MFVKCKSVTTIEDPVCVMSFQCEKEKGHTGNHTTTYPGVEGDVRIPVYWSNENEKTEFVRGGSRKDSDLRIKR